MRFSIILAGFAAVVAAIPAADVVKNIKMITTKSQQLQTPAGAIKLLDGPLLLAGQGNFPPVITGFTEIVTLATNSLNQMNPEQYTAADSDIIFDAFRDFVRVHQALLNILIGKAGLLQTIPFVGQPMAAVLRAIEGVVDTLAFTLIDMAQSRAMDLKTSADQLMGTVQTAITSYEGVASGTI